MIKKLTGLPGIVIITNQSIMFSGISGRIFSTVMSFITTTVKLMLMNDKGMRKEVI